MGSSPKAELETNKPDNTRLSLKNSHWCHLPYRIQANKMSGDSRYLVPKWTSRSAENIFEYFNQLEAAYKTGLFNSERELNSKVVSNVPDTWRVLFLNKIFYKT